MCAKLAHISTVIKKKKKSYFTGIDGIFSSHLSFVFYALPINNISQF